MRTEDFMDWADGAQRELEHRLEQLREKGKEIENYQRAIEMTHKLATENEEQATEIESLKEQLMEEKRLRAELEMKVTEMSKLSAGMAKKASQEDALKVLRIFVNKSKRKKLDKRIAVKEMVLEMANANGIILPLELATVIDGLDDEHLEPSSCKGGDKHVELHNHFEAGSSAQVFNNKVIGKFEKGEE